MMMVVASYTNAERTVGQHVDYSTLATTVKYQLARADGVPVCLINVDVYKGKVKLSGLSSSQIS